MFNRTQDRLERITAPRLSASGNATITLTANETTASLVGASLASNAADQYFTLPIPRLDGSEGTRVKELRIGLRIVGEAAAGSASLPSFGVTKRDYSKVADGKAPTDTELDTTNDFVGASTLHTATQPGVYNEVSITFDDDYVTIDNASELVLRVSPHDAIGVTGTTTSTCIYYVDVVYSDIIG